MKCDKTISNTVTTEQCDMDTMGEVSASEDVVAEDFRSHGKTRKKIPESIKMRTGHASVKYMSEEDIMYAKADAVCYVGRTPLLTIMMTTSPRGRPRRWQLATPVSQTSTGTRK